MIIFEWYILILAKLLHAKKMFQIVYPASYSTEKIFQKKPNLKQKYELLKFYEPKNWEPRARSLTPNSYGNPNEPGPALSTHGNLARASARGMGSPRTVEHRYLPGLGCYETLMMRAKD